MDKICTTFFLLVSVTFVDQIQARYDLAFILTVLLYRCYELYTIDDENKIDWLDSTILKLQHLLFFCFSWLIFQLHFGFVLEFHCPKLLDSFLSIDLFWFGPLSLNFILTFIYMSSTVRERGSWWYNDTTLDTSSDKLTPKMHVSQIKNDQALLTLYRERWLKKEGRES